MATLKGGEKVQAFLDRVGAALSNPATLRVGFLENARYPDGTPVAMIAAIHNYGAPRAGIPPRPFMSNTVAKHKGEWPKAIADLLRQNDFDAARTFAIVGHAIAGQIRQGIVDTNSPPLQPATIARKGFAKPLVQTGHMLQSVDFEVRT